MLSIQRSPEQLLAFLPPGKALTLPDTTDQCKGIIWLPNDDINPLARKMVDMGESIRQVSAENNSDGEGYSSGGDITKQRKMQKKLDVEFARLAKRVRMETLKDNGAHEVEIWSTALKMMVVARALLLEDKNRAAAEQDESGSSSHGQEQESETIEDTVDTIAEGLDNKISAILSTDEEDPSPRRPPILRITSDMKFEIEDEWGASIPVPQRDASQRCVESHQQKTTTNTRAHVNPNTNPAQEVYWRYGLPLKIWRRIIAEAVGADGILNNNQQEQIMRYASHWDVLAYKLTIIGVEDYQQIWKFLEMVGCFTYGSLN